MTRMLISSPAPRLPLAVTLCAALLLGGCHAAPAPAPVSVPTAQPRAATYPPRPSVAPAQFKVFHTTSNSVTLVVPEDSTDAQIEALIWHLREAARDHDFDRLGISQKLVDARDPIVWFHIYRGTACADEKYTAGTVPCGAAYHAAGDFTFGGFTHHDHTEGALLHNTNTDGDQPQTQLWDPNAPHA